MILRDIEKYLEAKEMPPTLFGRLVARDPRLVHDMRRGRQPGARMQARIAAFIAGTR